MMKCRRTHTRVAVFIGAVWALCVFQASAAPYEIALKSGPFVPPSGEFAIPKVAPEAVNERVHVLLQLHQHLQSGDRARFERQGVSLLHYFPDRAYVASIPIGMDEIELHTLGVRWASFLRAEWKIHPRISSGNFGDWSRYHDDTRVFAVNIMKDVGLNTAREFLAAQGFEVGDELYSTHVLFAAAHPERVRELAANDFILYIAETPPPLTATNDMARMRVHADEVQALPYDLRGAGVTALVFDGDIIDHTHNDFSPGRVILGEDGYVLWHATHVAGTMGGNGMNSDGQYRGMAPEVRIISMEYGGCVPYCLYDSPQDIEENYEEAITTYGAEVASNSISSNVAQNGYPCEWEGDYETTSQLLDAIVRGSLGQPFTVVFAAGNERTAGNPPGRCGDSHRTMGVPAGAKNIISVGATDDNDNMADFSSWGPTDDGRVKPEICAPGVNINSTFPGNDYFSISGTSMATPVVSGCIALLLEQWHRILPESPAPLPETVKALLVASALDRGNVGPDYEYGYGIINIQKAVDYLLNIGFFEGELVVGETFTIDFDVPDTLTELDVVLAWSDVPGEYNVIPALVNDLDLWLVSPSMQTFRPWVLDPEYPDRPAETGIDSVNVVERVHVNEPEPGQWTLYVSGTLPGSETQTFGVAGNVMLNPALAVVRGAVLDAQTSEPLTATVENTSNDAYVNANDEGNYGLPVLRDSVHAIRAWIYGYVADTQIVTVGNVAEVFQDFYLTTATAGTLEGYVYNPDGHGVGGAWITLAETPLAGVQTSANGYFNMTAPGGAQYRVMADYEGSVAETTVVIPEGETVQLTFSLSDDRFQPTGPDAYGYIAYEQNDIEQPAVMDWLEISPELGGPGEAVNFPHGDSVKTLSLPFVFRYYGHDYLEATLSADGWLAMGAGAEADHIQSPIPDPDGPAAMIAPFWDDMDVLAEGDISTYYDEPEGRFIIEFNRVPQTHRTDSLVTFQLILYDPLVRATPSCDSEIVFQYTLFQYFFNERDSGGTVGIESPDELTGLQIVYNGEYDATAFPIRAGSAICFTTIEPTAYGSVAGQVQTVPPVDDLSEVKITFGCVAVHPDTMGHFQVDSVVAGTYRMQATYPGYEIGLQDVVIDSGQQTVVAFEIWRLDPPRNLEASVEDTVVTLTWQPPLWESAQPVAPKGRNAIASLSHYKIYRDGEFRASVEETTYVEIATAGEYEYWVVATYTGGESDTSNHVHAIVLSIDAPGTAGIPNDFFIKQNYPNPFNAVTRIEYGLPRRAFVQLHVFDILGRKIAVLVDGWKEAGYHALQFDAGGLPSGIYFYRMRASDFHHVQKMLLIR